MASGVPGVTLQDTPDGSIRAFEWAVFFDDFQGVLAASRRETTMRANQRADRDLIEANDADQHAADGSAEDTHEVQFRTEAQNRLEHARPSLL